MTKIVEEWIKALKSGEYHQVSGTLRGWGDKFVDDGYCCLGVLCNLIKGGMWSSLRPEYYFIYEGNGSNSYLPNSLRRQIGMTVRQQDHLVKMNDNGYSFEEIAERIGSMCFAPGRVD